MSIKYIKHIASIAIAVASLFVNQAFANPCPPGNPPTNCAPPPGAILDLAGVAVPHVYTQYTIDFTAIDALTNISFAFREDPAFLFLDDVSVALSTDLGTNLLTNGGFESGIAGNSAPEGWTYLNAFGASAAGVVVLNNNPHTGSFSYRDGAVQAYDGITQAVATTAGLLYQISFWLTDNGSLTTFSQVSDNGNTTGTGGNGIDLLVYAGGVPTLNPVPEPGTLILLSMGLAGLGFKAKKKTTV